MQQIFRFIETNFAVVFVVALVWTITWIAFLTWRFSKAGPKFPSLADVTVLFCERFATGVSHHSWLSRLGTLQNCLSITVTDSELWTTAFFPFTALAGFCDLVHRIPFERLTHVTCNGRSVTVDFSTLDGDRRRIVLYLRRVPEFIAALPSHAVVPVAL